MAEKAIFGNMELTLYKDTYSLVAVREYNNQYYQQWCRLELGKNEDGTRKVSDKSQPVKVILGGPNEAVSTLLEIIHAITGEWYEPRHDVEKGDTPF